MTLAAKRYWPQPEPVRADRRPESVNLPSGATGVVIRLIRVQAAAAQGASRASR
jgi:hypothetical protein